MKNKKSNPVMNFFYDFIMSTSNINHTCPFDHDLVVDKLSTEIVNHRFTNILPFPEGGYMVEMHWIAYDITRAVVKHDFIVHKFSSEMVNGRLSKNLPIPEGIYLFEVHWIANN
ncbi:hypothetical protein M5D96_000884 [Drosophila gunungcola]|uniref:Uncharacterized protein n=1 Tax=Drosophila gunungcola TaxID=103775 RepID=A0A9P9YXL8_9MUSC|nr:hypothetical protein M5D96_000884 [Drosophila gunungcola]